MRSYMFRSICAVLLLISTLAAARALGGNGGWPLERYTAVSNDVLPDVLQRLFYAGSKQVKGYPISVVQIGGFPAVVREGQSIVLNSVAIAAMDVAIEADYLASTVQDGDVALSKYLVQLNDSAARFTGDWRDWVSRQPRFEEFYRMGGGSSLEPSVPYETVRQTIITSAIGSVLTRELAKMDFPDEQNSRAITDELNRRSAYVVGRASFDAAPGTALIVYEALLNIQDKKGRTLDAIECSEAKYQRALQAFGVRGSSREPNGTFIAFTASQRLFDRLLNCT
jgi:hypothetical protein